MAKYLLNSLYYCPGINELMLSMHRLKKSTDATRVQMIQEILDSIDSDHDGKIEIDLVLKVIDAVGRENVKVRLGASYLFSFFSLQLSAVV